MINNGTRMDKQKKELKAKQIGAGFEPALLGSRPSVLATTPTTDYGIPH